VVAYNKMDVPDSSEFVEDVKEGLVAAGLPVDRFIAVSAVTGEGVTVSACLMLSTSLVY
jgi:GTP-binding protein